MLKKLLVAAALAVFASPVLSSVWTLDSEQCVATRSIPLNGQPASVSYTSVNGFATFIVTAPGWNLPTFHVIPDMTVEHEAGNKSTGHIIQRSPDSIAIVWRQTDALEKSLNENATAIFRVILPVDSELLNFHPQIEGVAGQVRECVKKQNTV